MNFFSAVYMISEVPVSSLLHARPRSYEQHMQFGPPHRIYKEIGQVIEQTWYELERGTSPTPATVAVLVQRI